MKNGFEERVRLDMNYHGAGAAFVFESKLDDEKMWDLDVAFFIKDGWVDHHALIRIRELTKRGVNVKFE
jgi:hypothetical protein